MTSSIGITKILTFYFILLYLFLKVKMCAGSVHAGNSISDSDINYIDNDESFQPVQTAVSTSLETMPNSAGLVNYSAKSNRHQHAGTMPRAHHVRHEHHYMKNRHVFGSDQALRANKNSFKVLDSRIENHRSHHHHKRKHHQSRKIFFRRQNQSRQSMNPSVGSSYLVPSMGDPKRTKLNRGGLSISASNINQNTVLGGHWPSGMQKSPSPATESSVTQSAKSIRSHNSVNSHRKSSAYSSIYFEKLLNSFKTNSPYYKEHQKDSSQLIKSLPNTKGICNSKACKQSQARMETSEEYEDDEDDVDEDDYDSSETQGDAGYSTTLSPASYEVGSTRNLNNSQYKHLNNENNENDNGLHRDDAIEDKDAALLYGQQKHEMIESVTERRKIPKESHGIEASRLASSHAVKIRREGSCSTPKPKVILASDDPSKQYTPYCTILHRCGDDVGCCLPTQTCAPSKNSTVELYFFVQTIGSKPSIEKLKFVNHTECACINRHDSHHRRTPATSSQSPIILTPTCTCPSLFQRVIDNNNRCFCDCSSSHTACHQFKHGLEHFSMENRRCIKDGRCEEPTCEYGHYNKAKGKCPTREDKLSSAYKG